MAVFGWIAAGAKGAWGGVKLAGRLRRVYKEGKDLPAAFATVKTAALSFEGEARLAWVEVEEFVDAVMDVFPSTRD